MSGAEIILVGLPRGIAIERVSFMRVGSTPRLTSSVTFPLIVPVARQVFIPYVFGDFNRVGRLRS